MCVGGGGGVSLKYRFLGLMQAILSENPGVEAREIGLFTSP